MTALSLARLLQDGNRAERAEAAALAQDALDLAGQAGHARHSCGSGTARHTDRR